MDDLYHSKPVQNLLRLYNYYTAFHQTQCLSFINILKLANVT